MGRTMGKRSDYKKAIVTLKAGETIELLKVYKSLVRRPNNA